MFIPIQAKSKQLTSLEKQFEVLKWEYEVLQVRFDRIEGERDELKNRFSRAVLEVQQKASMKAALLEEKLKTFQHRDLGPRELRVGGITYRVERPLNRVLQKGSEEQKGVHLRAVNLKSVNRHRLNLLALEKEF